MSGSVLQDPISLLESRKNLDTTKYSYKLQDKTYGMDTIFDSPIVDESKMALDIVFASGERRDGVGDLLEVGGIRLDRHRKNPIVLLDHGKQVPLPIALAAEWDESAQKYDVNKYTVTIDPISKQARLKAFFYRGKGLNSSLVDREKEYDHALMSEQLFDMAAKGLIRGGSIGYQVVRAQQLPADYETGVPQGLHLLVTLMLEGSLVVLPANMDTVVKALCDGKLCGKPLSPYLVKSFSPYLPEKKAQLGYQKAFDPQQSYTQEFAQQLEIANDPKNDEAIEWVQLQTRRQARDIGHGCESPRNCVNARNSGTQEQQQAAQQHAEQANRQSQGPAMSSEEHAELMQRKRDAKAFRQGKYRYDNDLSNTEVPPVFWIPGRGASTESHRHVKELRGKYKRAAAAPAPGGPWEPPHHLNVRTPLLKQPTSSSPYTNYAGNRVRVTHGPLKGTTGTITESDYGRDTGLLKHKIDYDHPPTPDTSSGWHRHDDVAPHDEIKSLRAKYKDTGGLVLHSRTIRVVKALNDSSQKVRETGRKIRDEGRQKLDKGRTSGPGQRHRMYDEALPLIDQAADLREQASRMADEGKALTPEEAHHGKSVTVHHPALDKTQVDSISTGTAGGADVPCPECGYSSSGTYRANLVGQGKRGYHVGKHPDSNFTYNCPQCGEVLVERKALDDTSQKVNERERKIWDERQQKKDKVRTVRTSDVRRAIRMRGEIVSLGEQANDLREQASRMADEGKTLTPEHLRQRGNTKINRARRNEEEAEGRGASQGNRGNDKKIGGLRDSGGRDLRQARQQETGTKSVVGFKMDGQRRENYDPIQVARIASDVAHRGTVEVSRTGVPLHAEMRRLSRDARAHLQAGDYNAAADVHNRVANHHLDEAENIENGIEQEDTGDKKQVFITPEQHRLAADLHVAATERARWAARISTSGGDKALPNLPHLRTKYRGALGQMGKKEEIFPRATAIQDQGTGEIYLATAQRVGGGSPSRPSTRKVKNPPRQDVDYSRQELIDGRLEPAKRKAITGSVGTKEEMTKKSPPRVTDIVAKRPYTEQELASLRHQASRKKPSGEVQSVPPPNERINEATRVAMGKKAWHEFKPGQRVRLTSPAFTTARGEMSPYGARAGSIGTIVSRTVDERGPGSHTYKVDFGQHDSLTHEPIPNHVLDTHLEPYDEQKSFQEEVKSLHDTLMNQGRRIEHITQALTRNLQGEK